MNQTLSPRHCLLALAVVAIWGTNFVVIRVALDHLPPLLFAALRFTLVFFPAVFFLPRPSASWGNTALYGLLIGVGQFGLLYIAMDGLISPGIASLVMQSQVLFTILLSIWLMRERFYKFQGIALLLAAGGLALIMQHTDGSVTPAGLLMVLAAACSWAGGNIASKAGQPDNMMAYVVWSSIFAVPPLVVLSWLIDGPAAMIQGIGQISLTAGLAVLWQAWGNTLFGFVVWGWLLARYPAATIAPVALLVPVFGMGASAWWLGESLPAWKLAAAALIMGGLALNVLWPRLGVLLFASRKQP